MEPTEFIDTVLNEGKNGLRCFLCFRKYEYLYSIHNNDINVTEENGCYKICIFDALSELFIDNVPAPVFEQICKACCRILLQFYTLISKYKIYMRIFSSFSENVYNGVGKDFDTNNEHKTVKCTIKINLIENTVETDGEVIKVIEDKLYETNNDDESEVQNYDDDENELQNENEMEIENEIQNHNNEIEIVFQNDHSGNEVHNNIEFESLNNNIENEIQNNNNEIEIVFQDNFNSENEVQNNKEYKSLDNNIENEIQNYNNEIEVVFEANNFENKSPNNIEIVSLDNNIENKIEVQANDNIVVIENELNGVVQDFSLVCQDFISQKQNKHSKKLEIVTAFNCELNNTNKSFICDECEMGFIEEQELTLHKDKIHYIEPKSLLCHICGKESKSIYRLKIHSLTHTKKKCPHCPKMLLPNSYFKLHVQSHTSGVFMCNDCEYNSTNKGSLEAHINKVHNKKRPHVCEVCKKGFYKKSHLVEHKVVHESKLSRRLICSVCHMNFSKKKCLDDHMRNHTGDKPYKCDFCEATYVTASRRSSHMQRKHLGKTHQCQFCSRKFCLKTDVNRHVKNVHSKKRKKK